MPDSSHSKRFKPAEIARSLPETASTLLLDEYLTDQRKQAHASSASTAKHLRTSTCTATNTCTSSPAEVPSGWVILQTSSPAKPAISCISRRQQFHAIPDILEAPLTFLAFDIPRRDPKDIVFINPADGTAQSFIQQVRPAE